MKDGLSGRAGQRVIIPLGALGHGYTASALALVAELVDALG